MDYKKLALRYWYVIVLLAVVLSAFWVRSLPARYNELQALDPFLFYRMSEHVLYNDWQMPNIDSLRYYPVGVVPSEYVTLLPVYIPAVSYAALSTVGLSMPYLNFAILFPAVMGALAVFIMYFVGKELFNSRTAGLFAAFFLGVVPAFLTRTSAGFFEKEPIAGVFMMLTVLFFIKAFKSKSSKNGLSGFFFSRGFLYGCISGISLALMTMTWGGFQYMYLLTGGFIGLMFGINLLLVVLDYLFPGNFSSAIEKLETYIGPKMIKAYLPMLLLSVVLFFGIGESFARSLSALDLSSPLMLLSFGILAVMVLRVLVRRSGLMKSENTKYFIPGVMVFGFIVLLIGSMFSPIFSGVLYQLGSYVNPQKQAGELGTTIAENLPGDLNEVTGKLSNSFSGIVAPQLDFFSPYFTVWIFMILGSCLLVYEFAKTKKYIYLLPLFWVISSIWSVFAKVRLTFLVGPAAAIGAAFLFMWLLNKAKKYKDSESFSLGGINLVTAIVTIIVLLSVIINFSNAFAYGSILGPSICFPITDEDGNIIPCLEINDDSTYSMNPDQPWYQALAYLEGTGQDNSVLSWWDFGYWFQARGKKPSVADGGNLGDNRAEGILYAGRNKEIAQWFISPTNTWDDHVEWLQQYDVGYILMDYTLIGKYGAITSIASEGQNIQGFMEFRQSDNVYQNDENQTVFEFKSGPYAIWVPVNSAGTATGSLKFMQEQEGRYYQIGYVNNVCTENGLIRAGLEEQDIGGCVAMGPLGVYYIPPESMDSIFVSLMFMDGDDLPLETVFDNAYVKIYKVLY